jgi:uncharacterized protein
MRTVLRALSLGLALTAMGPAFAAAPIAAKPAATAETPDARLAAARDLLVAMQAREMFRAQFEASLPKQMANIQREYPDMTKDMRKLIETTFREETEGSLPALMNEMANLYAKRFSADDLKTIATFHRTKAGTKLRHESEQLQRELSGVANTWSLEVVRKISKRLQEQLREDHKKTNGFSS